MREDNLLCVRKRKFLVTTDSNHGRKVYPNLACRMALTGIDQLWVADITYIPTWAGFLYLAVVLDVFSRRIVGWSMSTTLHTTVVLDALSMALAMRRPRGVIHHSDQGAQYTSIEFGNRCREAGVRPSMGSVGDAYDNAMAESFFATLECELLARSRFKTQAEARNAVFEFIEGFYNPRRRHSSLAYLSPVEFERRHLRLPRRTRSCRRARSRQGQALAGAQVRDLDSPCARRLAERVGRDGRMGSARAEQKDGQKEQQKEDTMTSDAVA